MEENGLTSVSYHGGGKRQVVDKFKLSENDSGSPEVQVALMTTRITYLTDHFKAYKKDLHSRRGLHRLVNQRRKLLKYLKKRNVNRYYDLIKRLGLRDSY